MEVSRSQAKTLSAAITEWQHSGALDLATANRLEDSLKVRAFDWKRLAKYSFWIALICVVTAIGAVINDKFLMEWIETLFNASHVLKCIFLSSLSVFFYTFGFKRRKLHPEKIFSVEAILFLGVLSTAGAVYELGEVIDNGSGHYSLLILLSFVIYATLGFFYRSKLIWIFALASLGSWLGTETGYVSGWGAYYLGMNYPLRFVLFGSILVLATIFLEHRQRFIYLFRTTLGVGLLYLFIALWILSIFGNYGDLKVWSSVKQVELFAWSILFALASAASIYHGLKTDNGMTKGFGITFLLINLYTRFFEYFWDGLHKAIFFSVLALSFWCLGSQAEKIWHLGEKQS